MALWPRDRRKTLHGAVVGVVMVETWFTRWPGDVGNAATFPFPVQYRVVRESSPAEMVRLGTGAMLAPFRAAAEELVLMGVDGIATSCGFLALYQKELAASLPVPVATSALLQVPMVEATLPAGRTAGVLTYAPEALGAATLEAVGVRADIAIGGFAPGQLFRDGISAGRTDIAREAIEAEVLAAARDLLAADPAIGAIVCECTNLSPFSAAIRDACNVPVYDVVSLVEWFHAGLRPRRHPSVSHA
ncbi:MAG: aspartate/glutamate racemase family protein [Acetobacteraceae bacterium]|nr:aspartate/glutamate racemase family protein [Acetobacteraceae bacterium]